MAGMHDQVYVYTEKQISKILTSGNAGWQKAVLADLRKGVGRAPGEIPELWGVFLQNMPETFYSTSRKPTRAEWAVYTALTLFAVHQQGHDPNSDPMNRTGASFGSAVGRLVKSDDDEARIIRRFNTAATSSDIAEAAYHLRTLVQLLRGDGIPLDYPALARDLYLYQNSEMAPSVRLQWGRDFYRVINKQLTNAEEGKNE